MLALLASATAQFGFYDLNSEEDTKFRGTTGNILPSCFSVPNGICGDSGRTVFSTDNSDANLLSWYTFDDAYGLDHSGNANHALTPPPNVGPGHDGRGQGAMFSGFDSFVVPNTPEMNNVRQLTVGFWIYLTSDSTDAWRVLFRKGDAQTDLTPTLLLFPDSRKLHVRLTTSDPSKNGLDSVTAVPLRRWTHIAVVLNYNVISLYINGIQDSQGMVTGQVVLNNGDIHFGKHPLHAGSGMFIDDVKVYSVAKDENSLQVEASMALPGFGPNFLRLGCKQCELQQAIENCASTGGYHLCRRMELQGGGLVVARAMGYLDMSSDQWAAEDPAPTISLQKLGLCCLD